MSWYNPALGGVNCSVFSNGTCISKLANGESWQDWMNKNIIACPIELSFGTQIKIDKIVYICKDRGGAITYDGQHYWVDVLTDSPTYSYGQVVEAILINP